LYWLVARIFDLLQTSTMSKVARFNENADTINEPFSLAAGLSVIGFYNSSREFYVDRVFDQKVEPIQGLDEKTGETIWDK
jgi:hypothetical protein